MGKKKRGHPDVEEILARPWCYYCERDFDDLKILISHQKAKHFKCERCGRRLNTAGGKSPVSSSFIKARLIPTLGLSVHLSQVHKETLTSVDNALPNRAGLDIEIFGMEGIPEDIMQTHRQRVLTQFHQAEADRRVATGNPPSGAGGQPGQTKKPKLESISEMKKRLAEHKAAKLAAEQGGSTPGSGTATPSEAAHGAQAQSPAGYVSSLISCACPITDRTSLLLRSSLVNSLSTTVRPQQHLPLPLHLVTARLLRLISSLSRTSSLTRVRHSHIRVPYNPTKTRRNTRILRWADYPLNTKMGLRQVCLLGFPRIHRLRAISRSFLLLQRTPRLPLDRCRLDLVAYQAHPVFRSVLRLEHRKSTLI